MKFRNEPRAIHSQLPRLPGHNLSEGASCGIRVWRRFPPCCARCASRPIIFQSYDSLLVIALQIGLYRTSFFVQDLLWLPAYVDIIEPLVVSHCTDGIDEQPWSLVNVMLFFMIFCQASEPSVDPSIARLWEQWLNERCRLPY